MADDSFDLSVVVACYNEEGHLERSIDELIAILDHCRWRYELVFVEDCSKDATRAVITRLFEKYKDHALQLKLHEQNAGRGQTVTDGIRMARGRIVGFLDIDLEIHAVYIPRFVIAIENGHDVAVARRIYNFVPRLFHRFIMSKVYLWLEQWLLGVKLKDTEAGFKFFNRQRILPVLDEVKDPGWFWDTEIMVRSLMHDHRIAEIPCLFIKREDKRTTMDMFRDPYIQFRNLWRFRKQVRAMRQAERRDG